jgi:hypothetical protein
MKECRILFTLYTHKKAASSALPRSPQRRCFCRFNYISRAARRTSEREDAELLTSDSNIMAAFFLPFTSFSEDALV